MPQCHFFFEIDTFNIVYEFWLEFWETLGRLKKFIFACPVHWPCFEPIWLLWVLVLFDIWFVNLSYWARNYTPWSYSSIFYFFFLCKNSTSRFFLMFILWWVQSYAVDFEIHTNIKDILLSKQAKLEPHIEFEGMINNFLSFHRCSNLVRKSSFY